MARNPAYHDPPLQEKKAVEPPIEAPQSERLFSEATTVDTSTADPAAHTALDALLLQTSEPQTIEKEVSLPEASSADPVTESEPLCAPVSSTSVAPQPSAAASHGQAFTKQRRDDTVIGFTEETAQMFVQIERALGNEMPLQSMQRTEAEISEQLKWTKPVEEMSSQELDRLFDRIEANIKQPASKVET